ncbi:ribonuclease E activity regulator RraA [Sporosarcina sp. Te-1]|uniref:ribonuclease E activity regulator RraA n=1 Tax=Sporosarcina sp. Te-1 TaxID=2818390 RepID=UPI001A9D4462|nr:ribonuclease E activity regulator RraA [Sporosarcina sp. Te-1]QTD41217.1 ribonuclease E activity regulator RraA [Sporosarcina sp. Te-1]
MKGLNHLIKTADLHDEFGNELTLCTVPFRSYGGRQAFSGPIHTVRVLEDNVLVKESLETIPEGSVLVVDGGGSARCALLGDRLGGIAQSRRLSGIIVHGCVRDSADLRLLELGILAIGTNPIRSQKEGRGERDVPLHFGEVDWIQGHFVYADEDGVLIAKRNLLE